MRLSVGLGHTLAFVLLLDGVGVGGTLGSVYKLVGKDFGNGLVVTEGSIAGTGGEEVDGLVDAAEGRAIHSLTADSTGRTDTGGIFTGTGVAYGVNYNLYGVLVCEEVDDLQAVLHDAHGHELLTVVTAEAHERYGDALHDGALSLAELLLGIPLGGVSKVSRTLALHSDVVLKSNVTDFDIVKGPLAVELDLLCLFYNFLVGLHNQMRTPVRTTGPYCWCHAVRRGA